mgnify:CR=1 FL=1
MIFQIMLGFYVAIFLLKEYRKTKGKNYVAKSLHFASTFYILVFNFTSITRFLDFLFRTGEMRSKLASNLSHSEANLNYYNSFIFSFLCLVLFTYGIGLLRKEEIARVYVLNLFLIMIPFAKIEIFMINKQRSLVNSELALILIGILMSVFLYGSLYRIYKSKMMSEFFRVNQ